ncbi:MAG: hypothetical protein M3Z08_23395 [Chloroflexota bacterium]|nr:hypothetical protein [Chloroflexota bacterium]
MKRRRTIGARGRLSRLREHVWLSRSRQTDPRQPTKGASRQDTIRGRQASTIDLAVILAPLVVRCNERSAADDMHILTFSLHHMFCCFDRLYRGALPDLSSATGFMVNGQVPPDHLDCQQATWTYLHQVKRILERMEPLCHLLNGAAEGILDDLDRTSQPLESQPFVAHEQPWHDSAIEQAFTTLAGSLAAWQENHRKLTPFTAQFSHPLPAFSPPLAQFDSAFAAMLDSASAIFGDILLSFRTISKQDDEVVATLLFDLTQQSDQLLSLFHTIVEPLCLLIETFAVVP